MRFSNSFLDEIRDRVPISDGDRPRVSGTSEDQRAARRLLGLLPVPRREEPELPLRGQARAATTASAAVSGDHFKFLTELDGLSFPEAVQTIADMAGIAMPVRDAVRSGARRNATA
jgi:DNA primase